MREDVSAYKKDLIVRAAIETFFEYGYHNATVDLRYLWMRQKRLQGSHFANDLESKSFRIRSNRILFGLEGFFFGLEGVPWRDARGRLPGAVGW